MRFYGWPQEILKIKILIERNGERERLLKANPPPPQLSGADICREELFQTFINQAHWPLTSLYEIQIILLTVYQWANKSPKRKNSIDQCFLILSMQWSTKCQLALRFQHIGKRKISCVICKVCTTCGIVSPAGPSQVRLISRMARLLDLRKHNEIICSAGI